MKNKSNLPDRGQSVPVPDDIGKENTLLTIIFGKGSSPHYPTAVFLAQQAAVYRRLDDGKDDKKAIHLAVFTRAKAQAGHAAALLKIIGNWKTTQIHTPSKILASSFEVSETLECYFQSLSLRDPRAHCLWDGDEIEGRPGVSYPCTRLRAWTEFEYRKHELDRKQKIQMKDRIHDLAINKNCDWCPNFNINNYFDSRLDGRKPKELR